MWPSVTKQLIYKLESFKHAQHMLLVKLMDTPKNIAGKLYIQNWTLENFCVINLMYVKSASLLYVWHKGHSQEVSQKWKKCCLKPHRITD